MNPSVKKFLHDRTFRLESGKSLLSFELAYETYGTLNKAGDNAILICHGLTSDSHVARLTNCAEHRPGWWDDAVGPGKPFDTEKYFVVCSNVLAGCAGSTGPSSIDQASGTHFGLNFPVITVRDMVNAQVLLADTLGIQNFHIVVGGCLGGFQALEWMSSHPDRISNAIVISATMKTTTHNLGLWEVIRQAIMRDPDFQGGAYYGKKHPVSGMGLAQMFGLMIWMDRKIMSERFDLRMVHEGPPEYKLDPEFEFQTFLHQIGERAASRFDPNSLIYLTKAMDYFDLTRNRASTSEIFTGGNFRSLLIGYSSDWRYPPDQMKEICLALSKNSKPCEFHVLDSNFGHGAFIYDSEGALSVIRRFIS
jgi:homoserine O-acetyltransferase